jgi:hypothetical protein
MAFMRSVFDMQAPPAQDLTFSLKALKLLKENRIEMMIVSILLYSTGLLEQSLVYAGGVC